MEQLKLIIFDCDGVMFDSIQANERYYNSILKAFDRSEMDSEELAYVHIHNVNESIKYIFRHYPEQDLSAVDSYRADLDYSRFLQYMTIEHDLVEFLQQVKPHYHLAISTNRTNTMESILKIFHLEHYFGKVMTAQNARRPKPAPDALEEILEHYDCTADQAIYIGDSIIDRQHSEACNMRLIAFKNSDLAAEYHVNCFMEIAALPLFQKH